ncbi:hypothetical protein B0H10DRAFT_2069841 [Mycena sp. CBHHK59/15]|nr:hypothetical protein B0H10DRAFT_2069841 [Mycena sp. CBHHK59/15]
MSAGRNPFTSDDDALLVKYIAKYNPGVQGRNGNKIYKTLTENVDNKWSWSRRHSWQGWRDRYVKNQSEFNDHIKRYQKRKGLPTENSIWCNGTQKNKGSDDDDSINDTRRKRKRSSSGDANGNGKRVDVGAKRRKETEESSEGEGTSKAKQRKGETEEDAIEVDDVEQINRDLAPQPISGPEDEIAHDDTRQLRTHVPDIYPDLTTLDGAPVLLPTLRTQTNSAVPKPKLKPKPFARVDPDSDFFASVPPTPTTGTASRPPTTASGGSATSVSSSAEHPKPKPNARPLPKLVEGAFGTSFVGTRRPGNRDDEDDGAPKVWPPVRSRRGGNSSINTNTSKSVPEGTVAVPTVVNAVASSSRVQLPSRRPPARSLTPVHISIPSSPQHPGRSPSPLDWGSQLGSSPIKVSRRKSLPVRRESPPPLPNGTRVPTTFSRSVNAGARLSAPVANGNGSSPLNHNPVGGVVEGRTTRHSRAPSVPQAEYRLPSPPRAASARPRSGTPLAEKSKRRAPSLLGTAIHKNSLHKNTMAVTDMRRHSFPASVLPRVDFDSMRITAPLPRQSLPPRPPPQREPLPRRHGSLFAPRPTPTSSPSRPTEARPPGAVLSISASDRALVEHLANHNFGPQVVWNVYNAAQDLAKTDAILLRMRETAEAAGLAALQGRQPGEGEGEDHPEEPFTLRHRRRASATTTVSSSKRTPQSAASSAQRRKRAEEPFRPLPLQPDALALAKTEYTPPSGSRAGALSRLEKKGRREEGLMRERRRASGGGTISSFARDMTMQTHGGPDVEDDVPPLAQVVALAQGNFEVAMELEKRDLSRGIKLTAHMASFLLDSSVPRTP